MPSTPISNRERTLTGGSLNESGYLRERSFTGGSMKSDGSGDLLLSSSPRRPSSSSRTTRRRRMVDWIQTVPTPWRPSIPLVSGLDRVVYGKESAAQAVVLCGIQPPRYLWYMLSGAGCDVLQLIMDLCLYHGLGVQDASTCWALSFGASIVFRHSFHRYLVFGEYTGSYWSSLARMYGGYSFSIVVSTLFNWVLAAYHVSHYTAWIFTLLWTGIANYFILKKLWSFGGSGGEKKPSISGSVASNGQ